jgi:GNAT superfamily N-acetyltransferase
VRPVTFSVIDAGSGDARWALTQYFEELDRRFTDGFDAGDALDEAAARYNDAEGAFIVARQGDEIVGCGALLHLDADTSEIKRMWVAPTSRGTGLGKRLLGRLEDEARRSGRRRVLLDTNGSLLEAIAMYESAGYVRTERYNDNPYAEHWFTKAVDDADDSS